MFKPFTLQVKNWGSGNSVWLTSDHSLMGHMKLSLSIVLPEVLITTHPSSLSSYVILMHIFKLSQHTYVKPLLFLEVTWGTKKWKNGPFSEGAYKSLKETRPKLPVYKQLIYTEQRRCKNLKIFLHYSLPCFLYFWSHKFLDSILLIHSVLWWIARDCIWWR